MMYMVTSLWRGAHHIGNMRGFKNLADAEQYATKLARNEFEVRVYELNDFLKPKIVKKLQWK